MTVSLAMFSSISFVLCVAWGLLVPATIHASQFLEMTLPGFRWLTPGTFALDVLETFVIGAYAGLVFTLVHNAVGKRCR